ncbi:MAG: hypothetical protein EOO24_13650 [Comamonadaceae bacterium]|nr:MAG: hypothetical protein EOO24_13650 [Comamonadaceae bacterium]
MSRLDAERARLYGAAGPVVLGVSGRSPWDALAGVWQGVQADLGLPAPAIVVDGARGMQLWFALDGPVAADAAATFLGALRDRYLADLPRDRVALGDPAAIAPPVEVAPGCWSAFVAPDLASLFADEPWLDLTPGVDAQADLLARLRPASAREWADALQRLRPAGVVAPAAPVPVPTPGAPVLPPPSSLGDAPTRFLLGVMNDPAIDLHLRIEAAKALLPFVHRPSGS